MEFEEDGRHSLTSTGISSPTPISFIQGKLSNWHDIMDEVLPHPADRRILAWSLPFVASLGLLLVISTAKICNDLIPQTGPHVPYLTVVKPPPVSQVPLPTVRPNVVSQPEPTAKKTAVKSQPKPTPVVPPLR